MSIKTINTECTPEMLRAAALNSELGDLARNNLSGAWDLIIELWDVMVKAAIAVEQDLPQHYDDTAVVMFANAMKQKMAAKRNQGYSGWNDKEYCTTEKLQKMLIDHLAKGDPVDIGNFAMMLWSRGESVAAPAVEPQPATLEEIAAEEENVKPRQIHIIDAETRALAISICEHVLSHTHPWAFIDEAKKLKKLLGAE